MSRSNSESVKHKELSSEFFLGGRRLPIGKELRTRYTLYTRENSFRNLTSLELAVLPVENLL